VWSYLCSRTVVTLGELKRNLTRRRHNYKSHTQTQTNTQHECITPTFLSNGLHRVSGTNAVRMCGCVCVVVKVPWMWIVPLVFGSSRGLAHWAGACHGSAPAT
jgi:hypothetical protein